MNDLVYETILGQIVSKANSYLVGKSSKGTRYIMKSREIRAYERSFCSQCSLYKGKHIDGHFTLFVTVYESSRRYDLDNALKTLLDCLQMVDAISDDNLCTRIVAEKHLDRSNPRVVFAIQEHEPRLSLDG